MKEFKQILRKIRRYEIRIRKSVNTLSQGSFRSVFKGSGLEFDDLREYQYGDDVRSVNWNVTAKGHGVFINTYKEEKEQQIFFILDVSGSQEVGKAGEQKLDIAKEICGVLSLAALRESSSVGLLSYSDQRESYVRASKGNRHIYPLLKSLYELEPESQKTDLAQAITSAMKIIKRKSIIFFVSDFIDEDYETALRGMIKKHDVIIVHVSDERESRFPNLGIIPLFDKESGKSMWVNTSSKRFREQFSEKLAEKSKKLQDFTRRYNANYLYLNTNEDYVPKLIKLFRVRKLMKR
ncbi:MAG: DUF58 domain-containing protein [Bernardetiaceae bacterium]|nr:DUF58 domain-containing protein [Bernardetiaceae bacterium]